MKHHVLLLSLIILCTCCAQPGLYVWSDYPKTLYKYRKDTSEESLQNHVQQLEKIISVSRNRGSRVAPGLQAELGFFYLQMGRTQEAEQLFVAEQTTYPESRLLMKRMLEQLGGPANE